MAAYDLTEFTDVLHRFIELFDRMLPLEQKKLEVVSKKQVTALEDIIKKEQAEILILRGLDQKREKLQEGLGWKDLTFKEILERLPEEQQGQIRPLFDELGGRVTSFRTITESSKTMMEVNLHAINKLMEQQTHGTAQTYGEDGSVKGMETHFTDRRI